MLCSCKNSPCTCNEFLAYPGGYSIPVATPLIPSETVRNLGVSLDCKLSLESQVNKTVGSCFSPIRILPKILPLLPSQARTLVVGSVILSRLDYCNALLLEYPK